MRVANAAQRSGRSGQAWWGGSGIRHHLGVQEAPILSGRPWAWLWIAGVVFFSYRFVESVRDGHVGSAVFAAVTALFGVRLLVRSFRPQQRPRDWTQAWTSAFRFNLGSSILGFGFAVLATISAVQASGSDRIRYAVLAGVLYVIGAFFGLGTVGFHRYRSGRPLRRLSWVFRSSFRRGCAYCADDSNMNSGNLEQLTGDEARQMLLVKCPRCGWLYLLSPHGPRQAAHITDSQAARFSD
jgi:hypothetical protein